MILLHQLRDQSGPAGLMARADTGAVVAVKVFVERDQIAPVRIGLELFRAAENRPLPIRVAQGRSASSRRDISSATSQSVIIFPEPVGHSTLKLSPR